MIIYSFEAMTRKCTASITKLRISQMESTLCLSYFPRPAIPLNLNLSTKSAKLKQATRLGSSHSSFLPSTAFHVTRWPPGHVLKFNAVICELEKSSSPSKENEKKGDGMHQKDSLVSKPQFGGNLALKSFLDVSVELASSSSEAKPFIPPKFDVPPGPSMEDINAFKMEALRKMKSGKPEEAVKMLQHLFHTCKNESESAYNAEMALVEILFYQGKYEEASNCSCLKKKHCNQKPDGRFPLYKAIIYTMLNNEPEATKEWKEFAAMDGDADLEHYSIDYDLLKYLLVEFVRAKIKNV